MYAELRRHVYLPVGDIARLLESRAGCASYSL